MPEYYHVGKIVNTHGIKGEIKVMATTDFPDERFKKGAELYILTKPELRVVVSGHRVHKDMHLLTLEGYDNINDVEKYKGQLLGVKADHLEKAPLNDGEFFYKDVIGMQVQTEDGIKVGTISEILSPGANDVWVVRRPGKSDLLLPYIDSVILQVDVANKKTIVDIPEGLDPDEN
ncbi:ribosome maturation factor RimM [Lacticaseibacillus zhaodongensis]|uniref:ribosome maturation factor RimM n=1 Tax=Lacticaseibacillus zhaodongensis TaxID=2668065 RepID=UPI0012D35B3E|nr:ribosome maturation factor RimM [Lacticaseibacillus zhaodongensis]